MVGFALVDRLVLPGPNLQLQWDNPYSAGGQGARAQAPDNKAQTVTLAGAYNFSPRTTLSMTAALGEIRQEDALLPYTINPGVPLTALPRESLDGKIETTHVDVAFTSRPCLSFASKACIATTIATTVRR